MKKLPTLVQQRSHSLANYFLIKICKNCNKLRKQLKKEKEYKEGNYNAYKELSEKFKKLAVAYCYAVVDDFGDLDG